MSFNPNLPAANGPILSAELRDQFNGLKALIDALVPIGTIMAWHKNFPGTPALPGVWAECNGQTVDDVASPYHGLDLPDLNGAGGPQRFLRGAPNSGGTGGSDSLTIPSEVPVDNNGDSSTTTVVSGPQSDLPITPSYFEVVRLIRIK